MFAEGKADPPEVLGIHTAKWRSAYKSRSDESDSNCMVVKMNANYPGNPSEVNLPTIQWAIAVFNADNGALLGLVDSIELTIARTGAATGIASKYLSKKSSEVITIYGCGNQGLISVNAIGANRDIKLVYLYDTNQSQAEKLAMQLTSLYQHFEVIRVDDVNSAIKGSDIIVTCTPSRIPTIDPGDVQAGTFIAAVGCDSESKSEIHPRLMSASKVVTDFTEHSAAFGDLHHAIEQGLVTKSHVHAELGQIIAGQKTGRENDDEVIVFDSTGTALQDVAATSIVYERALARNFGIRYNFQN
jgi:ornithine cyclodeaminase/alanine dehydrogenase-like protein (mu-crystallin family)